MFLTNLQYTAGFNDIFDFTEYIPITDATKKMLHIKREKMTIKNFNINFVILFICFVLLVVSSLLRRNNEINVELSKDTIEQNNDMKDKNPSLH